MHTGTLGIIKLILIFKFPSRWQWLIFSWHETDIMQMRFWSLTGSQDMKIKELFSPKMVMLTWLLYFSIIHFLKSSQGSFKYYSLSSTPVSAHWFWMRLLCNDPVYSTTLKILLHKQIYMVLKINKGH